MVNNEFPIGQPLKAISTIEDNEFGGDELCLDEVKLYFDNPNTIVTLLPVADNDEIDINIEVVKEVNPVATPSIDDNQLLDHIGLGGKLMSVWVCENDQGYQDQVIFAFDSLSPSIAFIAEGSVIKVSTYSPILKDKSLNIYRVIEDLLDNPIARAAYTIIKLEGEYAADSYENVNSEREKTELDIHNQHSNQNVNKEVNLLNRITIETKKCGGIPCIRGMRIRVTDILQMMGENVSIAEILEDFPDLEPEDIQACLLYAAQLTNSQDKNTASNHSSINA